MAAGASAEPIPTGEGRFIFQEGARGPLPVWTYRPAGFEADGPVLFVMHGAKRDPVSYRKPWIEQADRLNSLLLLPEFDKQNYAKSRDYQQAGVVDNEGAVNQRRDWSPNNIEAVFDHVVAENGLESESYYLYGHSAGGQFVHRMMLLMPEARVELAIAANAGWYTLPNLKTDYPEGLRRTPVDASSLAESLAKRVVVLLGDQDINVKHRMLPSSAAAAKQGPHRLARGMFFFAQLEAAATEINTDLAWTYQIVPGVGHSNPGMAPAAAQLIAARIGQARVKATAPGL